MLIRNYLICMVLLLDLVSCRYETNAIKNTPEGMPSFTPTLNNNLITPMSTSSITPTLYAEGENIFIGEENGVYIVFTLEDLRSNSITLPDNCIVLWHGRRAICESSKSIFVFDLNNGQKIDLPFAKPYSWHLTVDQRIDYLQENNRNLFDLFTYNLAGGSVNHILTFNPQDWVLNPIVSNDAKHIIGGHIESSKLSLVEINPLNNAFTVVGNKIPGDITDITWSPVEPILGVGSTEFKYQDIPGCTTTIFSTYNATSGEVKQIAHAPFGTCYEYSWSGYARNIWSPDGSMVILIAGKNICIVDISGNSEQNCILITKEDEMIKRLSWSPNSQQLAYIVENMSTGVFSLHIYTIADHSDSTLMERMRIDFAITDFIWSKP
jgi:hypothetical protein